MRIDDLHDEGADPLGRLMALRPHPGRSESVRVRCREHLERRRRRLARVTVRVGFTSRVLAPALVGGFCLIYAAALVATTLRLEGVF